MINLRSLKHDLRKQKIFGNSLSVTYISCPFLWHYD
jgi:hypothetical protein